MKKGLIFVLKCAFFKQIFNLRLIENCLLGELLLLLSQRNTLKDDDDVESYTSNCNAN